MSAKMLFSGFALSWELGGGGGGHMETSEKLEFAKVL